MDTRIPLVVLLAGPNGAGKSTSAAQLLQGALAVEEFVNADTIAQGLSAYRPEAAAVAAGRVMLERLRFLADARRNLFASYMPAVDGWQVYDNSDLRGPRLIASGAAGKPAAIADPIAWKRLEEQQQ